MRSGYISFLAALTGVWFQPEFTTLVLSDILHSRQPEIPGHHTPRPILSIFPSSKISSNATSSLKQTFHIPSYNARFTVLYSSSKLPQSYSFVFCAVDQFYLMYLYLTFPPKLAGPWGQGLYLIHLDPYPSPQNIRPQLPNAYEQVMHTPYL